MSFNRWRSLVDGTEINVSAIPDSAIYRWQLDDVSTGTVEDSVASANGTVNGVTSISGDYQGGAAGQGDGANDEIVLTSLPDFQSILLSGWGFGFTVETATTSTDAVFGLYDSAFNNGVRVTLNRTNQQNVRVDIQASDANFTVDAENVGFDDGNKHRILVGCSPEQSSAAFYMDNAALSESITDDESPSTYSTVNDDFRLFSYQFEGSGPDEFYDGVLDDVIIYNTEPTAALASTDYDLQPWS